MKFIPFYAVFATKHISGGHLNPAVSLAGAASGHIDWTRGVTYAIAQVVTFNGIKFLNNLDSRNLSNPYPLH